MTKQEAWQRWPEHDGHNIGRSLGNVVCATCGYQTLERGTQPYEPGDTTTIEYPFWR